jgi:hypothetical protein
MMKHVALASGFLAAVLVPAGFFTASPASAEAPLVNFEEADAGQSLEDDGRDYYKAHIDLNIDAVFGTATVIKTGVGPGIYGAPTSAGGSPPSTTVWRMLKDTGSISIILPKLPKVSQTLTPEQPVRRRSSILPLPLVSQ